MTSIELSAAQEAIKIVLTYISNVFFTDNQATAMLKRWHTHLVTYLNQSEKVNEDVLNFLKMGASACIERIKLRKNKRIDELLKQILTFGLTLAEERLKNENSISK